MSAITFDTLAYVKKLRDAGIEEKQAEAQAVALASVLKETSGELATRQDVERLGLQLKQEVNNLQSQINLLKWMLGFNLAMTAAGLWAVIRMAH